MNLGIRALRRLIAIVIAGVVVSACSSSDIRAVPGVGAGQLKRISPSFETFETKLAFTPSALEISPSGQYGVLLKPAGGLEVYSLAAEGDSFEARTIEISGGPLLSVAFSPRENEMAVAQASRISRYNLSNLERISTLTKFRGRPLSLNYGPKGDFLAAGMGSGEVVVWNLEEGRAAGSNSRYAVESYKGAKGKIIQVFPHPGGRILIAIESRGRVYVWPLLRTDFEGGYRDRFDRLDKETTQVVEGPVVDAGYELSQAALTQDGGRLLMLGRNGSLGVWRLRGLKPEGKLKATSLKDFSILPGRPSSTESGEKGLFGLGLSRRGRAEFWCQPSAEFSGFSRPWPELGQPEEPLLIASSQSAKLLWLVTKRASLRVFDVSALSSRASYRQLETACPSF